MLGHLVVTFCTNMSEGDSLQLLLPVLLISYVFLLGRLRLGPQLRDGGAAVAPAPIHR